VVIDARHLATAMELGLAAFMAGVKVLLELKKKFLLNLKPFLNPSQPILLKR
jgi:hypothetical protein